MKMKITIAMLAAMTSLLPGQVQLKPALGLSMEQARQTDEIQARYRPKFAAKRTQLHNELRKQRRAQIANDSKELARLEKVTEGMYEELRQIKLGEDAEIRRLLNPEQLKKFEAYLKKHKEMAGADRDSKDFYIE